jgi:hypothetical protein
MQTLFKITLLSFIMLLLCSATLSAQSAVIQKLINKPEKQEVWVVIHSSMESWVGMTFNYDTNNEIDLKLQKVERGGSTVVFDVSQLHKSTNIARRALSDPTRLAKKEIGGDGIPYAVAVWDKKIGRIKCAMANGKACKYCKKNGYHLENRLARTTDNYNILK